MKNYVVYNVVTGEIQRTGLCEDNSFRSQAGEGETVVAGVADDQCHMVDIYYGYIIDKPSPGPPEAVLLMRLRMQRNRLLTDVDVTHCNAERWELMTAQQKTAWRAYKQALRDLPATCDLSAPDWPTQPA